jgi:ABC-type lipoprotein release transport system permease subunit
VVSYTVAQRTNEFGIRMALGAQRGHVLGIVFASTVGSVRTGIGVNLAFTLGLNTVLGQWAKGNSRDPVILIAGALLLSFVSGIACAIPAWHASKVDPMTALRCEWVGRTIGVCRLSSFFTFKHDRPRCAMVCPTWLVPICWAPYRP